MTLNTWSIRGVYQGARTTPQRLEELCLGADLVTLSRYPLADAHRLEYARNAAGRVTRKAALLARAVLPTGDSL